MAGMDVALTAAQRTNIQTLRDIQQKSDITTERLSTGRKVNSVLDDAAAYFASEGLYDRAADLMERKDSVDQGISTLEASLNAIDAVKQVMEQMKGIAEAAKSQTGAEREASTDTFNRLGTQIGYLVKDASYNGLNMLDNTGNQLDIRYSDITYSRFTIGGFDLAATTTDEQSTNYQIFSAAAFGANGSFIGVSMIADGNLGAGFTNIGSDNSYIGSVDTLIRTLDDGLANLRAMAASMGSSVSLLTVRSEFAQVYTDTLSIGGDKLTLADMNEEGANLTALQTAQQIGMQSLAISGDQAGSILVLLQ